MNLTNSYFREVWNYKNADFNLLNNLIEAFNWDTIINETRSVNQACENFTDLFLKFCKECIPCKKVLIRQNDKPWFSSELRYNIRLRNRLRKRYFKTKRESDRSSFKRQRNKVNNMIKHAKETFTNKIDDILLNQELGNSCKTFWQVMGRFMGKKGHQLLYLLYENMMVLMDLRITKTWWFLWIYGLRKHDGSYGFTDYENMIVLMDLRITKTW